MKVYCSLQVSYESLVTWKYKTDYLHCSSNFHSQPRYDFVIVKTVEKPFFAQLLFLFACTVDTTLHPLALILPFDAPTGVPTALSQSLQLQQVCSKSRHKAEFISVKSIICGCVIVTEPTKPEHGVVLDVLDTDMFLQVRAMK
jgi:hypothetical protein